jgi:16S rRNA processing protein RimM
VLESRILMGVIGRPHGVRGWVRVTSYAEDLTAYGPLSDAKGRRFVLRPHGEGVAEIAELVDGFAVKVADRTAAEQLTNTRLYVDRERLPEPEEDEFYLADLVGLAACDGAGRRIGTVSAVHDYGAGTSLEIARENAPPLLVPFTRVAVPEVDIARGRLTIEPPTEVDASKPPPPPLVGGGRRRGQHPAESVDVDPSPQPPATRGGGGHCLAANGPRA